MLLELLYRVIVGEHAVTGKEFIQAGGNNLVSYTGPMRPATLLYRVTIGKHAATEVVIKPN